MSKDHPVSQEILLSQREMYKNYLAVKTLEEDWHAVWDVAVELYKIDSLLKNLNVDSTS